MPKRRAVALVGWVALTFLSGCSSDGGDDSTAEEDPTSTTQADEPSPPSTTESDLPSGAFPPAVKLTQMATLDQPVAFAIRTNDNALYIAEKEGRVRAIREGATDGASVLDIRGQVSLANEQGLLGIAFSPDGERLYVNYTDASGDTQIVEYTMRGARADASSRRVVLSVDQPYANHNGGHLVFGPDGMLYIGLGDGGSGGDPHGNGQDRNALLGKLLRIDPRPDGDRPYRIPPDNPFVGTDGARPEVWAYGLRNPWRFAFDRITNQLWIADVGQSEVEEINRQPGDRGGVNYGWNLREGTRRFRGDRPDGAVDPVHEYGRGDGCSVTGGFVYRGQAIPALKGSYVYADHCVGELIALKAEAGGGVSATKLNAKTEQVSSFGEDASGELYVLSRAGPVFRLDASG